MEGASLQVGIGTTLMNCVCELITEKVTLCSDHHRYYLGGRQLAGVTSVMKDVLPPSYDGVPEDTLEKARDRGVAVDAMVTAYVLGQQPCIPVGIRDDVIDDSKELFWKFADWFDRQRFPYVAAQVPVNDSEIAGTVDLWTGEVLWDVKCTYNILPSHHIQVAAYSQLAGGPAMMLIHLTKRHKVPRIIEVQESARGDWETVRRFWSLKRRLTA